MLWVLNQTPLALFALVFVVLALLSERFREPSNVLNILTQSSALAIAAIGMTFVLLLAGVDLSVGSIMFVTVAITGKLLFSQYPLALALGAGCLVALLGGVLNALLVVRLRIIPFIATLGMLFVARGFGLWLTNTRAMNMPASVTALGTARWGGVPAPIVMMLLVAGLSQWFLSRTAAGRQLYAIGKHSDAAKKAGVRVETITSFAYIVCGLLAGLSGIVSLTQTGAISPSFGQQREFAAIAAAVLGGVSLFGGRGRAFPGAVLGAVLFQMVENGLVILNADPYLYPLVISGVIFVAVLVDTLRNRLATRLSRRHIMPLTP
jgi:ribose transport system permease protein